MRSNESLKLKGQANVFEDGGIKFSNAAAITEDFQKPKVQNNTMISFGSIYSKDKETNQKTGSFKKRELENSNSEQFDVCERVRKLERLKSFEREENGDHKFFDGAVIKLQKFYTSCRTHFAAGIEEIGRKELDSADLTRSSVSFFNSDRAETAISRWKRASTWAVKVGMGLSKDEKAQTLAPTQWLEAIDPCHRYAHNLRLYYKVWLASESTQPFFRWLNMGDGKEVKLEKCSRTDLQHQCIKYLGPKEREAYEVIVENEKLLYKKSRAFVNTPEGSKWIFVLSTSGNFYVGEKKKGFFQHSSFLAGGATTSSGRLVAHNGILKGIWPFSGHYRPTEEHFNQVCSFLKDQVDFTNVKKYPLDDDIPPKMRSDNNDLKLNSSSSTEDMEANAQAKKEEDRKLNNKSHNSETEAVVESDKKPLSQKWSRDSTEAGARISCVIRDYPTQLQFHALNQQVNLSPKILRTPNITALVLSPIRSPKFLLSPRLA